MGIATRPDIRPLHNSVLIGDCLKELKRIPSASVDLVFADPPYNLQLAHKLHRPDQSLVDAVDEPWDKFASFAEAESFTLPNQMPRTTTPSPSRNARIMLGESPFEIVR